MTTKRTLWKIHNLLGLYIGILIAVLSISGAFAVFKFDLDRLAAAKLYDVFPENRSYQLTESMRQSNKYIQETYDGMKLDYIYPPQKPDDPIVFQYMNTYSREIDELMDFRVLMCHVNPYNSEILGVRRYGTSLSYFLRTLHVRLFDGIYGRQLVGIFGIFLLASTITGFLIYGNFMRSLSFGAIRKKGLRVIFADWHKLIGICALFFNLMIAVTGAWLGLQGPLMDWFNIERPNIYHREEVISAEEDYATAIDLEAVSQRAEQYFPEMIPTMYKPSKNGQRIVEIFGNIPGFVYESDMQKLILDKADYSMKFRYNIHKQSFGDKLFFIQEALHFGDFAGIPMKILYALFGLTTGFLSISGYYIYLKRNSPSGNPAQPAGIILKAMLTVAAVILLLWISTQWVGAYVTFAVFPLIAYSIIGLFLLKWIFRKLYFRVKKNYDEN